MRPFRRPPAESERERQLRKALAAAEKRIDGLERALGKHERREAKEVHGTEKTARAEWKRQAPPLVPLEYRGADLRIVADSKWSRKRKNAFAKEPHTVAWIEQELEAGDAFYDIGANVGAYSLIAASVADVHAYAFEPGFATFASLCTNVIVNGLGDRVSPFPVTLAAETGLGAFRYSNVASGAALHDSTGRAGIDAVYTQPVLTVRLDDLVRVFGLPTPQHVKLDVDGAEVEVLRGAPETLRSPGLRTLMLEVTRELAGEVEALLRDAGLELAESYNRRGPAGEERSFWYDLYRRSGSRSARRAA